MKKNIFIFGCLLVSVIFIVTYDFNERNSFQTNDIKAIGNYYLQEKNIGGGFGGPGNHYLAICTVTNKCSEWQVKGIKYKNKEIYIYFSPVTYSIEEMLSIFKNNSYSTFDNGIYYTLDLDINNTKIFGIFTQETMNFYSINDLKELPEEQQKILLELKEKPRFIYE